jgi:DNA mismatch repair protein MutS
MTKESETPLMKQYFDIKSKHPDAILFFRVGDFYELYGDDAIVGSAILGIVQTKRSSAGTSIAMAGFPYHALDTYLPKLVRAGKRVAICDQLEDPKETKKLVKRGITELVTPGISINDNVLNNKENNFLAAVYFSKSSVGIAFLDISTGEFLTTEGTADYVDKLLTNFSPKEILVERDRKEEFMKRFDNKYLLFYLDDWVFTDDFARARLLKHFETQTLKGFGVNDLQNGIIASGAILHYLDITQHTNISHITSIKKIEEGLYVRLDKFTVRNLELINSMSAGGVSLLDIIDRTVSPMGGRLLRRWIVFPLINIKEINRRQDIVSYFLQFYDFTDRIKSLLAETGDIERIISKVAAGRVNPREIVQLMSSSNAISNIKSLCEQSDNELLKSYAGRLDSCKEICDRIAKEICPSPPSLLNKGGYISDGVNAELDELRKLAFSGKDYLLTIQQREIERTGITSLKISFNNVFGYYIEVRNTHKDKVPQDWIRKQTLINAERYITEELKLYEEKILGAEDKIIILEQEIFNELVRDISAYIRNIQINSQIVAELDCLISFAVVARLNKYNRPIVDDSNVLDIKSGRHPVIEKQLPDDKPYIANDVFLDDKRQQIIIVTGPNMSGKSALLRQTALIVLMSQIGSFVPAESSRIGYIDKIFTRVGASDNISLGESTFMVEMTEASEILNNMSTRSLVLFDELGRGTSTYDGISIAWSIVEYIHEQPHFRPKTLFATHYHELNEMARSFKRIKNFNVSVKEIDNKVIFLRKLIPGGCEHSFGIHVAKMAGMPRSIVKRSEEILKQLENDNRQADIKKKSVKQIASSGSGYQLSFFQLDDPVLGQIRDEIMNLDVHNLTPMDALNKLNDIKKILTGKSS